MIKSLVSNGHRGITSDELSLMIWPDASPANAKSNRGVAINKIRKILSQTDGIEIHFDDKVWSVAFSKTSGCDYQNYVALKSIISKSDNPDKRMVETFLECLDGGEFLKSASYEWLDPIKIAINNEIIDLLKRLLTSESVQKEPNTLKKVCEVVLKFDSVDEEALAVLVKTLNTEEKYNLAKSTFEIFTGEYKRLYDENYPKSFQELIS